jgi:hypothetical protein
VVCDAVGAIWRLSTIITNTVSIGVAGSMSAAGLVTAAVCPGRERNEHLRKAADR